MKNRKGGNWRMDPFAEVENDCWQQVHKLERFIERRGAITEEMKADFVNGFQELQETVNDLSQAVSISEANPARFHLQEADLRSRRKTQKHLESKIEQLNNQWSNIVKQNAAREREVTTMSNRISQDDQETPFADSGAQGDQLQRQQEQEYIRGQDLQLDGIHETMKRLNQQASTMGIELEDQGVMLDDFGEEVSLVGQKIQRGMSRVSYVLERNRDKASNCCIGLLILILIILLVVLVAV